MISYKIITPPAVEPVDVALFKSYKGMDFSTDDTLITSLLIPAARQLCEQYTNRKFINTTIEQYCDKFQFTPANTNDQSYEGIGVIQNYSLGTPFLSLSGGEIQSITSLKVYDINNEETTIDAADYYLDGSGMRLVIKSSTFSMPALRDIKSIVVCYVAGYGAAAANVPTDIRQAIIQTAQMAYDYNRQTNKEELSFLGVPSMAKQILNKYRVHASRKN